MDRLLKAVEEVGGRVAIRPDRWRHEVVVTIGESEAATLRLRERYKLQKRDPTKEYDRWSWRDVDHIPTGLLVLDSGPPTPSKVYTQDTDRGRRIEDRIKNVIENWIHAIGRERI